MEKFSDFINFISYKYKLNAETLHNDFKDFVAEENKRIKEYGIEDDYKNFIDKYEDKLNDEFNKNILFKLLLELKNKRCIPLSRRS